MIEALKSAQEALTGAIKALMYVDQAHSGISGFGVRIDRIADARAALRQIEEALSTTRSDDLADKLDALPEHDYQGLCPAPDTSPSSRDPACKACHILTAAAQRLRSDREDAERLDWLQSQLAHAGWTISRGTDIRAAIDTARNNPGEAG